jgi:hypothetical protein
MRPAHAVAAVRRPVRTAAEPLSRTCRATALAARLACTASDRLMLAAMHLASIDDLADVERVLEQMGKRSHAEADAAAPAAIATAIH